MGEKSERKMGMCMLAYNIMHLTAMQLIST